MILFLTIFGVNFMSKLDVNLEGYIKTLKNDLEKAKEEDYSENERISLSIIEGNSFPLSEELEEELVFLLESSSFLESLKEELLSL